MTLLGKGSSLDEFKVKILRSSQILPTWALNPVTGVLIRDRRGEDGTEKRPHEHGDRAWLMQPPAKECLELLEAKRGMEAFSP